MTPTAAEMLAVKIVQTWPKSPPVDVWVEDIIDLDEGAVGTAMMRLRRESDFTPSIAKFRATVLSLRTLDGSKPRPDPCQACDDTGWIEADPYIDPDRRNANGDPITYTQVRPCVCREGRAREQSSIWRDNHPSRERAA